MFTSQLTGLPFSFTAHAKDIYTSDPRQLREKIELSRFVVTCTEYNRRHLLEISDGHQTSIDRIYHGIDTDQFSYQPDIVEKPVQPFQILTVARLTPKKGLPTVYKALKILSDRGYKFKHTLIGDGEDRDIIRNLIDALGLGSAAQWLGTRPHHVVLEHYKTADLFVLGCQVASNGDRDGIPNVLVESMAMGVPVVATNISAIPELVQDEKTGLLAPAGQPDKLAEAMLRMLTDAELRSRVVAAAREHVTQNFDNRQLIQDLAEIYSKKMGRRQKADG
jgi:glycosyltransferase involved in cell wall biosynthesis